MRKSKFIISITLCIILLLSVVSCKNADAEKLIGTWEASYDIAEYINEGMTDGSDELADYFKIDNFTMTMIVTYNEDGTYSMVVDEEKFKSEFESLTPFFTESVKELYRETAESAGITVDELVASMGMTVEELVEQMMSDMEIEEMASELKVNGKYKISKGKLWTTDSADEEIDESKYETYEFTDDSTIRMTGYVGDDADSNPYTYPLEYKRVS